MRKLYRNIALLVIVTLFYSCIKRHLDAGIKTTVTGTVFDYNIKEPIANVPIYIDEYVAGSLLYGPRYRGTIDSTRSDSAGNYSISFFTTGQGIEYRIRFKPNSDFFTSMNQFKINVGGRSLINFLATKFHVLKARLQVTENPNPPMRVSTIAGLQARVWGTNNDTVVFMKIIPNQVNEIQFTITNVDTPSIYNYRIDTIKFSGFQDTFNLTIPVVPKLFPKRG